MRWRDIEIGFIKKNRRERFVVVFFDLFFIFFMFGLPRSLPFPLFLVFGVVCLLDCLSQKRLDLKDGSVFGVEDLVVLEFAFLVCFFFFVLFSKNRPIAGRIFRFSRGGSFMFFLGNGTPACPVSGQ